MFPEEFVKRISLQKYIDDKSLMKALQEPSPVSIRINKAKWSKKPASVTRVEWSSNGYYLEQRPSFTADPLFHSGCYYPQEASGMFLEQAVLQSGLNLSGIRVLDLCAAPGGKSTILSDLIGDNSLLIANEVIRARSLILAETISKWGATNTIVTQSDPSAFSRLTGYFDLVFIDAPCSGEGMFRTNIAVNEWSVNNAALCSERQKRIIMDVWPALKENGILIYSTCTFNPGENEENIRWLIDKNRAECITPDISAFEGITPVDFEGITGYGFYPGKIKGEGFFIAVIRKTSAENQVRPGQSKNTVQRAARKEIAAAGSLSSSVSDRLIHHNGSIVSVPADLNDYSLLYQNLKIVRPGTTLLSMKNDDILPDHDLALSRLLKDDAFPSRELNLDEAHAYLKRDVFPMAEMGKGWNIVTYKNVTLGFVKNIGNRINNYFPVEWRIRMEIPENVEDKNITWE